MLEGDHRVIAVDLYGYGETPMPEKTKKFTLLDEVGIDVGEKVAHILHAAFGERMAPPGVMKKVTGDGRLVRHATPSPQRRAS